MKKHNILLVITGISVISVILFSIYLVSHWESFTNARIPSGILSRFSLGTSRHITVGETDNNRIIQLSDNATVSPTNGSISGTVLYYEKQNGHVWQVRLDGTDAVLISETDLSGFIKSIWSHDRSSVLSLFSVSSGPQYKYFNFNTGQSSIIGDNIEAIAWSPNNSLVLYMQSGESMGNIFMANPDGTGRKSILRTRIKNMKLFWPAENAMFLAGYADNLKSWELLRINDNNTLDKVLTDTKDFEVIWGKDGEIFLFSAALFPNPDRKLYIGNARQKSWKELQARTTASRCIITFDQKSAICGVPISDNMDVSAEAHIPQKIVQIFFEDGTEETLFEKKGGEPAFSVRDPFLSPLENYIVFTNTIDGKLYSIKLK